MARTPTQARTDTPARPAASLQSVQHAIDLLHCFSLSEPELGVTDLSIRAGLTKSTTFRTLRALEAAGLVRQSPTTGKYSLGLGLLKFAGLILAKMPVESVARPFLERLRETSGETVNLSVFDETEVVNIVQLPSQRPIKHVGWIGRSNPLHCTSGGKVVLACLPEARTRELLSQPLRPYTSRTITDPAVLMREVETARERGYAIAVDEFQEEITGIAAPVLSAGAKLVAILGVSGPSYRMGNRSEELADQVREAARATSAALGYVPADGRAGMHLAGHLST